MKRPISLLALTLVITIPIVAQAPSPLQRIIPLSDWARTGINRLSDVERAALSNAIVEAFARIQASSSNGVAVIAPSLSTSAMARSIRSRQGWPEVPFKRADNILVVVRSSLYNPLNISYVNVGKLIEDAEQCLNISGGKYHIYIYALHDDLSASQSKHDSFEAND